MSLALTSRRAVLAPGPWVKDDLWRRARAVPTLDLRFADNKRLTDSVTGASLVTFTRASSGTFVDSAGVIQTALTNVPRFDHNPTTGESLGLLVEEARTNLLLRSAELDNVTSWTFAGGTLAANNFAAPDSTQSADTVTLPAGGAIVSLFQVVSCTASTTYTFSFYARLGTLLANDFTFAVRDDTNAAFIAVDIVPGVTLSSTQWNRVTYTFTTPVGCVLVRPYLIRRGSTPGGTVHFWGAQLEAGAFPTSYIPTTTAAVTRSADVASITGSAFSSWYRQDEGTLFADLSVLSLSRANQVISLNDGTTANRIEIRPVGPANNIRTICAVNSASKFDNSIVGGASQDLKLALAIQANNFALQANASRITPASNEVPIVDRLFLNYATFAGGELSGTIRRLTYWPTRLANSTLQNITL